MTADQPSAHAVPHPEIRQRADEILRYYRTIPDSDAIAGLCLRLASAEILDNRHSRMLAEVTADRERLRALVGDENQPGWDGCSRAEAIRQAEAKTDALLEWVEAHDARRDERDQALAEVERLRAERDAMLRLIGDLVDGDECWFDHHGGCQAHGYLSLGPGEKCPQQEAKELIEASNGGEQR